MVRALALLVFTLGCEESQSSQAQPPALQGWASLDEPTVSAESDVIRLVNEYRNSIGLNALVERYDIRNVARAHSQDMAARNYFSHADPEGHRAAYRLAQAGIVWTYGGENLAAGYPSTSEAFAAWMASPGHRKNIENPIWEHTGVGYAFGPSSADRNYWTQLFITP